jgi:hypothetical protein
MGRKDQTDNTGCGIRAVIRVRAVWAQRMLLVASGHGDQGAPSQTAPARPPTQLLLMHAPPRRRLVIPRALALPQRVVGNALPAKHRAVTRRCGRSGGSGRAEGAGAFLQRRPHSTARAAQHAQHSTRSTSGSAQRAQHTQGFQSGRPLARLFPKGRAESAPRARTAPRARPRAAAAPPPARPQPMTHGHTRSRSAAVLHAKRAAQLSWCAAWRVGTVGPSARMTPPHTTALLACATAALTSRALAADSSLSEAWGEA